MGTKEQTKAGLWDLVIIGSGPAGLTAGLYAARANLSTLLVAGEKWGGQLMLTSLVENYPGFPDGIMGPVLMQNMRKQAERFGVKVLDSNVSKVDSVGPVKKIYVGDKMYQTKSVLIATGADTLWLGVPNEQNLIGRGVSSCAPCDAFFFKDKRVIVVGGGDSAMEEALTLAKFASEVTIVHRRDKFRASKIMQDRVLANPKIKVVWNARVSEILGEEKVEGVILKSTNEGEEKSWEVKIDGVFVAIGHKPNTDIFGENLEKDIKGYVVRGVQPAEFLHPDHVHGEKSHPHETQVEGGHHPYKSSTSIPGVFVAGDVHDHHYRQAITAAGYGCEAAMEIEKWLEESKTGIQVDKSEVRKQN